LPLRTSTRVVAAPTAASARRRGRIAALAALVVGLVAFPSATAGADVVEAGGWTTSAAAPSAVTPGQHVGIHVTVTSHRITRALVDVEIHDDEGERVFQTFFDQERFVRGTARSFHVPWNVPADADLGQYVVHVGVFRRGWGELYHWNHRAGTFTVTAGGQTPPTTAPPTTAPPTTSPPTTSPPTTAPPTTAPPTTAPPATTVPPPPPAGLQFSEEFRTASGFYDRFVTQVHHRDTFQAGATWPGEHSMACEGPDTTRTVHGDHHEEMYWWCAPRGPDSGHMMTSMGNMSGYSIVAFSPNQVFPDVNRVCFDINMTAMDRKWFEVAIVPEAAFQANGRRLDYVSPGAEDVDQTAARTGPGFVVLEGGSDPTAGAGITIGRQKALQDPQGFSAGTDKATRFEHCMWDDGQGRIHYTLATPGSPHVLSAPGSFPDGPARVIFKDHSYDPGKGGGAPFGTWHWDNIEIG
jgi:hypothetical protein